MSEEEENPQQEFENEEEIEKKKILIIAGDFVEDYEIMVPYQVFQISDFNVDVICPGKKAGDSLQTVIHDTDEKYQFFKETKGHIFKINKNFEDTECENYSGLFIPGGRSPEYLQYNRKVLKIIKYFIENNLPICSVCHGPLLLLATKLMNGKEIAAVDCIRNSIELSGAKYSENEVTVDGNIVTGKTYLSHVPLLKEFLQLLG